MAGFPSECLAGMNRNPHYGGEEFAVLLPHHTLEGALAVAEEIRASVSALRAQQQGRPDATPTISAGIATMIPTPGLTPQDLVKSADLALYEAKRKGRDCAVPASAVAVTLARGLQLAA